MSIKIMTKTAYINARIDPELKAKAEVVFNNLGIKTSDVITMFFSQVVLHKGIPFPLKLPNAETVEALAEDPATLKGYTNSEKMMEDIFAESD
jgi:DNA-damage-inducible protein J